MNDEYSDFESKLAKLQPMRLTRQQRQRLHNSIADKLSEDSSRKPLIDLFHIPQWLAWSGAAATAMMVAMLTIISRPSPLTISGGGQLASSNVWEIEEHDLNLPDASSIRVNQFFHSESYSNLPQAMLHKI